ncbi:hypothetical protein EWG32_22670 [Salmonella enterica subsp. enterica serovar Weltevreden]|nr:hypothetical protein [Salmonella enterica subsp. enterica serovar Weltevreden]ECU9103656.1 hypothetical protein [Salmonella enterica subsp. enterica serovar Muenchen]MMR62632.1 hypothetical protein [Salmonella enterica subsp. enterica serovar Kisangani]PRV81106.1 hypothetical protein B1R83_07505 [Salmonella enterica subsp. enterica serovar Weltevreden]PRV81229.1 hypothetical protein B1R84_20655 [Salmonella enterica subsp. enterica serovar Weltevreden]
MSQRYSDLEALRMMLVDLERKFPGSVVIDPATGGVSLIGWSLEQFNNSKDDKCATDNIEGNSSQADFSGVTGQLPGWSAKNSGDQYLLVGVVNPFADSPQSATKGNESSTCCRVCSEDPGSIHQEDKESASNKHFVPVVKSKLGDRVFHVLSRLMFWKE